jgi:nicotinate-nucleotide adenylyltransferase
MGGTFDPVHYGHLILAEQARESFGLDKVLFVTAAVPPHKAGKGITDAVDRHEMVKLALANNSYFVPSEIELSRKGPSYTVDTMQQMVSENPNDTFFLLLGSDEAITYGTWYRPERIIELANVVIANRPGCEVELALEHLPESLASKMKKLKMPGVDISSSDIRDRVSQGKSIRYLVPPEVADYIYIRGLYR